MTARNPLVDPQGGDWLTDGYKQVRVDEVRDGKIYFARFWPGEETTGDFVRLSLEDFRRLAVEQGARVMETPT